MNHTTNIKDFLQVLSSEAMVVTDVELPPRSLHIPLEFVVSAFQWLNVEIGINDGLFLCYVKSVAKKNMYIETITVKKRNRRSHCVILHSDKSFTQSEMLPVIIEHETDYKIHCQI